MMPRAYAPQLKFSSWTISHFVGVVLLSICGGCQPDLLGPDGGDEGGSEGFSTSLDPPIVDGISSRVVRLNVNGDPQTMDPSTWVLVEGTLGAGHLRQLAAKEPSKALAERFLPVTTWQETTPSGHPSFVLAPLEMLDLDRTYTMAGGSPPFVQELTVGPQADERVALRVFPPPWRETDRAFATYCTDAAQAEWSTEAELHPGAVASVISTGSTPFGGATHCYRLETAPTELSESLEPSQPVWLLPPPYLDTPTGRISIDPVPLTPGKSRGESSISCDPDEHPLGPGCAAIADDRVTVRTPEGPLQWTVAGHGLDRLFVTDNQASFQVRPLPSQSEIFLNVMITDLTGETVQIGFGGVTAAPMAHLVISEVLADAVGPEPEQEWVELYNDGQATANLELFTLIDVGGETPLHGALEPGRFAVVVNETYVGDGEYDPAPPGDVLVVVVPSLGKNGLANSGEPLKLIQADGTTVSRFPAIPKPKTGISTARLTATSSDDDPASYFHSAPPTPGRPNGVEWLDAAQR